MRAAAFVLERERRLRAAVVYETHTRVAFLLSAASCSFLWSCHPPVSFKKKWISGKLQTDAVMLHFLLLSLLLHLLPFSSCSSSENSWCSEGRQRLDSVAFLACQQQGLSKLHKMGIWITRSLDPNWQVGNQLIIT